jgi:coenzyme F420 hydrogenase subunit beta
MEASIEGVVASGLCIGCGGCAAKSISNGKLEMQVSIEGIYEPVLLDATLTENESQRAIAVCPFNPKPAPDRLNEDVIAKLFWGESSSHNEYIGLYKRLYAGYSVKERERASSGGLATWILKKLLNKGIVDGVLCVEGDNSNGFKYAHVNNVEDIGLASKTKYYPVTLTEVIDFIDASDSRFAITGVPCFIKAIRLRQMQDSNFSEKIKFTVGIFCGGYKTKGFTEYLIQKSGGTLDDNYEIDYRKKSVSGVSSDYSFSIKSLHEKNDKSIKMSAVGDMWGTGLFKPNACDFCDDMASELSDISLGDAWIEPYNRDPNGTNVVVTRSSLADEMVRESIENGELILDEITEEQVCLSQKGNITHRRKGLAHRLSLLKDDACGVKRVNVKRNYNLTFSMVQAQRTLVREKSLDLWAENKSELTFDNVMNKPLSRLRRLTVLNHLTRKEDFLRIVKKSFKKIIFFKI